MNAYEDCWQPEGTTRKELIVCYEENNAIWNTLILSLRDEFSLSIQEDSIEQVFENVDLSVSHGHDNLAGILDDTSEIYGFRHQFVHGNGYIDGLRRDHLDNF